MGLLLDENRIAPEVVAQIRSWRHTGFSVDRCVRLPAGDRNGIEPGATRTPGTSSPHKGLRACAIAAASGHNLRRSRPKVFGPGGPESGLAAALVAGIPRDVADLDRRCRRPCG